MSIIRTFLILLPLLVLDAWITENETDDAAP